MVQCLFPDSGFDSDCGSTRDAFLKSQRPGPVVNDRRTGALIIDSLHSIVPEVERQIVSSDLLNICEQIFGGVNMAHVKCDDAGDRQH